MTKATGLTSPGRHRPRRCLTPFAADPPNVIVVDVHLPIMNGVEGVRALRRSKQFQNTPLMVLDGRTRRRASSTSLIAAGVSDSY